MYVTFTFYKIAYYNRKLQKTEGQRRSPRLSTLEIESHDHLLRQHLDSDQGPAFRTRGRKNTKLRLLQQLKPSTNQVIFLIYVTFFTLC